MKKYLLILLLISVSLNGIAQSKGTNRLNRETKVSITGIVTFMVSEEYGNRADIGGMVYLIPYSEEIEKLQKDVDILTEKSSWLNYCLKKDAQVANLGGDKNAVKNILGSDYVDAGEYIEFDSNLYERIYKAKETSTAEALIDANGMYKLEGSKQGVYYIMIKSANKKFARSICYSDGLVHFEKVDLSTKTQVVSNYTFTFKERK